MRERETESVRGSQTDRSIDTQKRRDRQAGRGTKPERDCGVLGREKDSVRERQR